MLAAAAAGCWPLAAVACVECSGCNRCCCLNVQTLLQLDAEARAALEAMPLLLAAAPCFAACRLGRLLA